MLEVPTPSDLLVLLPAVFGLGVLGLGMSFLWGSYKAWRWLAQVRKTWELTPGHVFESTLEQVWKTEGERDLYYWSCVRYAYTVLDQPYTGDQVGLETVKTVPSAPQERVLRQYPVGQEVVVW